MKIINFIFLGFFLLGNSLIFAEELPFNPQRFETNEGLHVIFIHEESIPIVVMKLGFHAGSIYDGPSPGLAQLVANSLGQATTNKNANQIAESLDASGAEFSVSLDPDMSVITMHSQSDPLDLNAAVNALVPIISDLNINSDNLLNLIVQRQIESIEINQNQPMVIAHEALMQALFSGTPYEHSVLGSKEALASINKEALMDFYHQYYVNQNGVLVLVGDIDFLTAKAVAESFSKSLPIGQPAASLNIQTQVPSNTRIHINFPSKETTILIGQLAKPAGDHSNLALLAGSTVLAGPTMESLLFNSFRQEGLVYSMSSSLDSYLDLGVFSLMAETKNESASEVSSEMQKTFDDFVMNGPSQSDLEHARSFLSGKFELEYSSDESLAALWMKLMAYGYSENYLNLRAQNILLLSPNDIKNAFQKMAKNNPVVIVTVGGSENS